LDLACEAGTCFEERALFAAVVVWEVVGDNMETAEGDTYFLPHNTPQILAPGGSKEPGKRGVAENNVRDT